MPKPLQVAAVRWNACGALSYRLHGDKWRAARGIGRLVEPDGGFVYRYVDGLLDGGDDDAPAIDGGEASREWWGAGRRHRDGDRPARRRQRLVKNGEAIEVEESYFRRGLLHRDGDLPAICVTLHWHGATPSAVVTVRAAQWFVQGRRHRDGDRPAYLRLASNGACKAFQYSREGKLHRLSPRHDGKRRVARIDVDANFGSFYRFGELQGEFELVPSERASE